MSWERIEGDWTNYTGKARKRWSELTDEDFAATQGRREELEARIQERYRIAKQEASQQVEEWMKEPGVLDDWNDRRPILDM